MSRVLDRLRLATAERLRSLGSSIEAASGLESISAPAAETEPARTGPGLIPIASGKGGVGKTNISVNLALSAALALASKNGRVILIDGDLGLPNADLILGVRPPSSLADFARREITEIEEILSPTRLPNLFFLAGEEEASLLLGNLYYQTRKRLERAIGRVQADLVLFDLGASASKEILDFFALASNGILVVNPEPTSMRDGYVFLKNALLRRLWIASEEKPGLRDHLDAVALGKRRLPELLAELAPSGSDLHSFLARAVAAFRPRLIVNRTENDEDGRQTALRFSATSGRHLGIVVEYLGSVPEDPAVRRAVRRGEPFRLAEPNTPAALAIDRLREKILAPSPREGGNLLSMGRILAERLLSAVSAS